MIYCIAKSFFDDLSLIIYFIALLHKTSSNSTIFVYKSRPSWYRSHFTGAARNWYQLPRYLKGKYLLTNFYCHNFIMFELNYLWNLIIIQWIGLLWFGLSMQEIPKWFNFFYHNRILTSTAKQFRSKGHSYCLLSKISWHFYWKLFMELKIDIWQNSFVFSYPRQPYWNCSTSIGTAKY